eukprot:6820974-Alexandrium_andersonii.AAC.1
MRDQLRGDLCTLHAFQPELSELPHPALSSAPWFELMIAHPVSWRTLVKGASAQVNKHFVAQHRAHIQQEGGRGD